MSTTSPINGGCGVRFFSHGSRGIINSPDARLFNPRLTAFNHFVVARSRAKWEVLSRTFSNTPATGKDRKVGAIDHVGTLLGDVTAMEPG